MNLKVGQMVESEGRLLRIVGFSEFYPNGFNGPSELWPTVDHGNCIQQTLNPRNLTPELEQVAI